MKKLTFRLFAVIMLIYVTASAAPLFSQDGSPGHHHGPAGQAPPTVTPGGGTPAAQLNPPGGMPGSEVDGLLDENRRRGLWGTRPPDTTRPDKTPASCG
jgi:hypothetical protein